MDTISPTEVERVWGFPCANSLNDGVKEGRVAAVGAGPSGFAEYATTPGPALVIKSRKVEKIEHHASL